MVRYMVLQQIRKFEHSLLSSSGGVKGGWGYVKGGWGYMRIGVALRGG